MAATLNPTHPNGHPPGVSHAPGRGSARRPQTVAPSTPGTDQIDALLWRLRPPLDAEVAPTLLVGVTAPRPREGATTVALGLAVRAALDSSLAVLLVDAHAQQKGIPTLLNRSSAEGLSEVLAGDASFADVVCRVPEHNFDLLTAGKNHRGIHPERLVGMLNEWREAYDLVVVDLPPAGKLQGLLPLAQQLDGTLLVVRGERSRSSEVADACHRLGEAGVHLVGSVLNRQRDFLPRWLRRWF